MAPVLHPNTNSSLALGNQQDPIFILGHIARLASHSSTFPLLQFPFGAQLFERALEVFNRGFSLDGFSCVCSQTTGGLPGGEIRKSNSGMGRRRWKGDSR